MLVLRTSSFQEKPTIRPIFSRQKHSCSFFLLFTANFSFGQKLTNLTLKAKVKINKKGRVNVKDKNMIKASL